MPGRYADPFAGTGYPTNPAWALAGASLARALFGDPQARAQQELRQAQVGQAEAAARENDAQALLYGQQFKARGNLAQAVEGLAPITAPAPTVDPSNVIAVPPGLEGVARVIAEALPSETGGPAPALVSPGAGPTAVASAGPEHFSTASLAALAQRLSEAGQLGEAGDLARLIAAHAGGDELARRGVVGAGGSPGEWFAITPERRDQIATQDDEAAMARARLTAETAARGQDLSADVQRRGQDVGASTQRRGQDIGASTTERGQDVGAGTQRRGQDVSGETERRGQDRRGRTGGGRNGGRTPVRTRPRAGQIRVDRGGTTVRIIPNEAIFRSRTDGQEYVIRDGVYVRGVR